MTECPKFSHLLVLPHLRIQNANAASSPLTHGFPSITAFLGFAWALERKCRGAGLDLGFPAIGVVCHDHQEQVTDSFFVKSFRLTRNPVDNDGSTAAIVEEGRIHLDLSLVLAVQSEKWLRDSDAPGGDITVVSESLASMRVAGGTLLPLVQTGRRYRPYAIDLTGTEDDRVSEFRKARLRLLPGFALVSRDDRLEERQEELYQRDPEATSLDALLSLSRVNRRWNAEVEKGEWVHDRRGLGWLVPIPVGYGALGVLHAPATVANARDATTPFRFVESLYSIGEWMSPHRLQSPQQLLWYVDNQPDTGLYRCRNDYRPSKNQFDLISDFS